MYRQIIRQGEFAYKPKFKGRIVAVSVLVKRRSS